MPFLQNLLISYFAGFVEKLRYNSVIV